MHTPQRDRASYTDPNGYVYWLDGQVYRRIYAARADFFKRLLAVPSFQALMAAGTLSQTTLADEDADGLVLAHDRVAPLSYPGEWSSAMLREAGRVILEVAETAAASGYQLADGHPWNVLFDGTRPVFIDWGSLTEPDERLLWPAEVQFNRSCRYPLHAYAGGAPELARARLGDLAQGLDANLAWRSLSASYKLAHPAFTGHLLAQRAATALTQGDRMVEARAGSQEARPAARAPNPEVLAKLRPGYFRGLARELAAIRLPGGSGGWEAYYAERPSMRDDEDARKLALVERLLAELRPATALDLGANTGRYSLLAAKAGARVVALDQDDASMSRLYHDAKAAGAHVLPLVMDLACPTPATGWCAEQRPDALTRLAGEGALMLALIHHLVFTGNASLEQVARLAERACTRFALIEWVGPEDAMSRYLRRTATKDFGFYTLEGFTAALRGAGFAVEALAPHAEHRQLLVCRRDA